MKKIITTIVKIITIIFLYSIYIYGKKKRNTKSLEINIYEKEHIKMLRETASECTLFLNKNEEFPIEKPSTVLLIGSGAKNTIKGGLGSGDVESRYFTTCDEGLQNAGFIITSYSWLNSYPSLKNEKKMEHLNYMDNLFTTYKGKGFAMVAYPEYDYNLQLDENEEKADIAIYVLSRNSGEGIDRRLIKGDVLLTDTEIRDILYLDQKFKKFMLVLNVGGVVDLSPVRNVSNILLLSQLGVVTGDILADIILGKTNPSGKLATTWSTIYDYKFMKEFGNLDETHYLEGVYVGYRYFNSAKIRPLYPFGFGQSYTNFEMSKISLENEKEKITIKVKIKNIGKYAGKEVVQIYVSPSQENADKPYQSLVAFKKTPLLEPNNETELSLSFKLSFVARYDEKQACYILDKGNYIIRVGNSSENTNIYGFITLSEDIITEQLKNIFNINNRPDFEDYKPEIVINEYLSNLQEIKLNKEVFNLKTIKYEYEYKTDPLISNLNDKDLAALCIGNYLDRYKEGTFQRETGLAGSTTKYVKGIKNDLKMADGPAGLRLTKIYYRDSHGYHRLSENPLISNNYNNISDYENKEKPVLTHYRNIVYQYTTAIPIATGLAQTFNEDLLQKYGDMIGKEMEVFNINLWLAPALNIHRNILCGRNFEYFSEDPLISGKMASAITKGVQLHMNRGTTIKHFAGNNQEFNRLNNNSKMSERALREIYLKGFQIAVEESKPFALMTSYNLINGIHTSQNPQLLINVLRSEWNFEGLIMTDWSHSFNSDFEASKYPPQNAFDIIKAGTNLMMPGGQNDYDLLIEKLNANLLT